MPHLAMRLALTLATMAAGLSAVAQDLRRDDYFAMKRAFGRLESLVSNTRQWGARWRDSGRIDLYNCSSAEDIHGGATAEPLLADLAFDVTYLRETLVGAGVPDAGWRPALVDLEARLLDAILAGRVRDGLAYVDARDAWAPALVAAADAASTTPVVYDGGCGAGEISVEVRLSPPDAKLWLIPLWSWLVCDERGAPADDVQGCLGWKGYTVGATLALAGDYRYQAVWPRGAATAGFVEIRDSRTLLYVFSEDGVSVSQSGG